jgi:homoprotocatechuate degradation regulator HpaR
MPAQRSLREMPGASLRPLERSLTIALLKARESVMVRFRPLLHRNGFTEQQWRVIRVLAERSSCDAAELAAASCILPASLSRILRTLQEAGILVFSPSDEDSRRLVVALTADGRRHFQEMGIESERIYRQIEQDVGAAELERILSGLNQLTSRLARQQIK